MDFNLASWNVNSVRTRLPNVLVWLERVQPDMLLMQETKCRDEEFPVTPFSDLYYNVLLRGQKSYNGVAILAKEPVEVVADRLPGDAEDWQARYLECICQGIRVINVYAPNGNPIQDPVKFPYKLDWMRRLISHLKELEREGVPLLVAGDYNVLPTDEDCYNPAAFVDDAVAQPEVRELWRELLALGLRDALLTCGGDPHQYTYWSYRGGCWPRRYGLRLDHMLVNERLWTHVEDCYVDIEPRHATRASDHTPVVLRCRL